MILQELTETAIKKIISDEADWCKSSISNRDTVFHTFQVSKKRRLIKQILPRIPNLSLTQKNVVVLDPENVVNVVGKNVVGGLRSHSENVVDLSETIGQNVVETNQETSPYSFENVVGGCLKRQWAALYAARQVASEKPTCIVLARLYNEARTYFQSQT